MMKTRILLVAAAMAAVASTGYCAKSPKRGVSENEFRFVQQAEALAPGVSWYYNWGNTPHSSMTDYSGIEYAPMCWNGNYNADAIREYCKSHPGVKYLLGFNEPNFTAQSNMTPEEAAEKWPAVKALADELGLKLVAPALNYSPNTWQPIPWMDAFIKLVGNDAFDYLAIHSYGGVGVMQKLATDFHERYGKDVLVTEFCYWPGETGYVAPATQISAMIESVTWLEKTPWIHAYAWFKAAGSSDSKTSPNYGLLLPGKGDEPRELSEQGYVYVYMTDFNPDVWNAVNTTVAASEYIDATKIMLGKGANPDCPKPIEITQFSSGATADYQFDVPADGEYVLTLTVTGVGEPVRFNPCLSICGVKADGKDGETLSPQQEFSLPGNDTEYRKVTFPMTLKAGHQTLRVKDMYQFMPSGIRLSTLELTSGAGVELNMADATDAPAEYYDMQGFKVTNPVAGRIYIVRKDGRSSKQIYR